MANNDPGDDVSDLGEPFDEPLRIAMRGAKQMGVDWRDKDFSRPEVVRAAYIELAAYSKAAIQGGARMTREMEDRDRKIFAALGDLTAVVREAVREAKAAGETSTLVAAQFSALHGDVQVEKKDLDALKGKVDRLRQWKARATSRISSHDDKIEEVAADVNDSQKLMVVTAEKAAQIETDRLSKQLTDQRNALLERDLAEARRQIEKRDDEKKEAATWLRRFGADKGLGVALGVIGFLLVSALSAIVYLLLHTNPFVH